MGSGTTSLLRAFPLLASPPTSSRICLPSPKADPRIPCSNTCCGSLVTAFRRSSTLFILVSKALPLQPLPPLALTGPGDFPGSFLCLCCSLPVLNPPTQQILIRTLRPRSNSPNVCPKKQVSSTGFPQPFDEASSMALSKHIILVILSVCLSVSLTLL